MISATIAHLPPGRNVPVSHLRPNGTYGICLAPAWWTCWIFRDCVLPAELRQMRRVVEVPLILEGREEATDDIGCQRGLESNAEIVAVS